MKKNFFAVVLLISVAFQNFVVMAQHSSEDFSQKIIANYDKNITRADFVVMIINGLGIEINTSGIKEFDDCKDKYYSDYLTTAKKLGLIAGFGDNTVKPDEDITKQDAILIIYNTLKKLNMLPVPDKSIRKIDDENEISDYAQKAVSSLVQSRVINLENGKIMPKSNLTRKNVLQFICSAIQNISL